MKILFLTHHFFPTIGGIESYSLGLSKELLKNNIDCSVVCLDKEPMTGKKLPSEETIQGINIKRVPFLDLGFYKIGFGLLEEIKKADLVHVQNIGFLSDFAVATKTLHKKPVVVSTHGGIAHTKKRLLLKKFYSKWLGFLLKKADLVIADSPQDFKEFNAKAKNIRLVENGVDLERFFAVKRKPVADSFVSVGRISKNKRIDLLLEAIAIIARQKPGLKLKIIGKDFDGSLSSVQEKIVSLGLEKIVLLENNASDAGLLLALSESEFFVSASEFEGFGIAIVEAMAAGCIPLLNNIDAFSFFVEDKKNGFLIDFADSENAATQIINAMNQKSGEKKFVSGNARDSVKKFSWSIAVKGIIMAYESVLK